MMPFDVINIGTIPNDGTGDPLRTAFDKTNDNFALAVEGPAAATSGRVAVYDGTTGKLLQDGTKVEADLVVGPASAVADTVALFDGTTGKLIKGGGKANADLVVTSDFETLVQNVIDMVLLVDTTAPSATTTTTLPLAGTVNVRVDWGDGTSETFTTSGNKTHTYASAGQYRVRIEGSLTGFGGIVSRPELVGCVSFGRLGITNMLRAFRDSANFTQAPQRLPIGVTDMREFFRLCPLFNGDVSSWNTSSATLMSDMFTSALLFNQNISAWNTSNVTEMASMFQFAVSFNQNVSGWDVRKVTNMINMFRGTTAFNQNIGAWRPQRCANFATFLFNVTLNPANYDGLLTGWTDFDGTGWDTGSITAFADAGGGQVTVTTSAAHGLPNGHVMRISGTTNYDGYYEISNVAATTFRITATFVATETGTWQATLMANCTFSGGNSKYNPAGLVGRDVLTNAPFNWTITDGGPV
jgi:surface protein